MRWPRISRRLAGAKKKGTTKLTQNKNGRSLNITSERASEEEGEELLAPLDVLRLGRERFLVHERPLTTRDTRALLLDLPTLLLDLPEAVEAFTFFLLLARASSRVDGRGRAGHGGAGEELALARTVGEVGRWGRGEGAEGRGGEGGSGG